MLEKDTSASAVEEIMQKIKNEVRKRQGVVDPIENIAKISRPIKTQTYSSLYEFARKIARYFKSKGFYRFVSFIKDRVSIEKANYVYTLEEFCIHEDEDFIDNVYTNLLQRKPDSDGKDYYLKLLRDGLSLKEDIVFKMYYSKEGKSKNTIILGAKRRLLLTKIYKIPFLGYMTHLLVSLINLPKFSISVKQNIEKHMNKLYINNKKLNNLLVDIEANKLELELLNDNLHKRIETKATKTEFLSYIQEVKYIKEYMKISQQNMQNLITKADDLLPKKVFDQEDLFTITDEEKHKLDTFYIEFENRFRGTREEIKEKLKVYLPLIESLPFKNENLQLLDVGCGRGEWLEILKEHGYSNIKGLDMNRVVLSSSKELDLNVIESDAVEYLTSLEDESLSIITGFHIIEHLPFKILMKLFEESYRVLKKDGMIIFETPNAMNILVGSFDFYLDPTHINPLHPLTIGFIAKQVGFSKTKSFVLNENQLVDFDKIVFNDLNDYVNVGRDFAVIGYKA